jgi:hypothetical protein
MEGKTIKTDSGSIPVSCATTFRFVYTGDETLNGISV